MSITTTKINKAIPSVMSVPVPQDQQRDKVILAGKMSAPELLRDGKKRFAEQEINGAMGNRASTNRLYRYLSAPHWLSDQATSLGSAAMTARCLRNRLMT